MAKQVDVLRALQDEAYAKELTAEQWSELTQSPQWNELVAENPEQVAPLIAKYGNTLTGGNNGDGGSRVPQAAPAAAFTTIGKRVPRVHGAGIVTGLGKYVQNMRVPGMLFMKTLRSPHPHAKIKSIDTSKAENLPGVVAVLHRGNLPKEYGDYRLGSGPPNRYLFNEEVYEVGAPIVAVAAESDHIADEAVHLINVEYEVLPAVFDFLEGMKASTPKQWDNKLDGTIVNIEKPLVRGDPDGGMAKAQVVVDNVANRSTEFHMPLEMSISIVWWDNDRVTMHYTTQYAHGARNGLAQALGLPQNKVRVIQNGYMGSGYGFRTGADMQEIHAAILSKITGRPVRAMATRAEDFVTRGHRPQNRNEMKLGVNRDGMIVAGQFKVISNVGAQRGTAASGAWFPMQVLYKIPNLRLEGIDVFTNSYKSSAYRCVGHPNGTMALETLVDKAAYAIQMDPFEFRLKNINLNGNPENKKPFSNPGIITCMNEAAKAIDWKNKWHAPKAKQVQPGVFHGIGMANVACSHGGGSPNATGVVIVTSDGNFQVVSGSNEIGDGQRTLMTMIASETLGIPLEKASITAEVDTDFVSDTNGSFGSIQTNTGGWGIYEAAADAKRQLLEWGAKKFIDDAKKASPPQTITVKPEELDVVNGNVVFKSDANKKLPVAQVVQFSTGQVIGRGVHLQDPTWERTAFATHAAEVEVDTNTGSVSVIKYVAVHDVGKALNPLALEQQIEGGAIMGLGAALTEELLIDKATGLPLNDNILDYKALSIKDVPRKIDIVLVEHAREYGVYGAHGIGEPPINPPGATIANAVFNAIGVRIDALPITREKVLAALKAA
jgi:CO/xanthine dehydrogenase Mo-binding subunit